jgi:hypothetical protein
LAGRDPAVDGPIDPVAARSGWLGFAPADRAEIAAAEARLGCRLPPSLREFLLVTNGWRDAGTFIHRLAGTGELDWLRDTDDAGWIEAYRPLDDASDPLERSLRLSLDADASVLFLDPHDVDDAGEWAAYRLASWSGQGPERHASFYHLMYDLYAGFHALRKPAGPTRDRWDGVVEQARLAALAGAVDEPLARLHEACDFGRDRAALLRFQMRVMLGQFHQASMSSLIFHLNSQPDLLTDPVVVAEVIPLLFVEDRLTHRRDRPTLQRLRQRGFDAIQPAIAGYEAGGGQPVFGTPEFDAAVRAIVGRVAADPAFQVLDDPFPAGRAVAETRRRLLGEAWPDLRDAMRLWRPLSDNHIAPIALFADPILAELLTPERGRDILATPRGDGTTCA